MRIPPEMMTQRSLRFFHMVCLPSTNSYFFGGGIRFTPSAGEMGGLPYAPETFDLITCTNALHYVAEPGRALAGLRRLLTLEGATGTGGFRSAHTSFSLGSIRVAHEADRCTVCSRLYLQRGASTLLTGRTRCRLRKRVLSRLALAWLGAARA